MLPVMSSYSAMSSLSLDCLSVRADQDRCHETERTVALRYNVRLDVAVVILARPDKATRALNQHKNTIQTLLVSLHVQASTIYLDALRNHVIDEPMLVPDAEFLEFGFVFPM